MALRNHTAYTGLKSLYKQKALDRDELLLLARICVDDITYYERQKKNVSRALALTCACKKLDFVDYF